MIGKSRLESIVSSLVNVKPHEISPLIHSASCFFFILSAYFVVLPLRDEGAISLGLSNLPGLFVGSILLTLVATPVSTLIFSSPSLSKRKSAVILASSSKEDLNGNSRSTSTAAWSSHGWFYVSVRVGLFLWVALLNLLTISSTWARVIDVMDSSRLFGFIGAGATVGQLFGSLFATALAWLGPILLFIAAVLMEFAAQASKGINQDITHHPEEVTTFRNHCQKYDTDEQSAPPSRSSSPKSFTSMLKPQIWAMLDGIYLIMSSTYLLYVSSFLWLSAVVSSFFYFQKVSVIAMAVESTLGRRRLFAEINSFIAVFILAGQLTVTGRILTFAGVTIAICSAPFVAFSNLVAIAIWPTWIAVAVSETVRKVCIDVIVQRHGDAAAAGLYRILSSTLNGKTTRVSIYAVPVCLLWMVTAFHLGHRQEQLAKLHSVSTT
ncbi:hypothetical protein RJ641_005757 [Dillenia turbinata]|uniref:ADP,ATP carrier protein n=1 Tax=Dillenia turbinata TaxID=194707 RepID=A0AAN8Z9D7_9MAGN